MIQFPRLEMMVAVDVHERPDIDADKGGILRQIHQGVEAAAALLLLTDDKGIHRVKGDILLAGDHGDGLLFFLGAVDPHCVVDALLIFDDEPIAAD